MIITLHESVSNLLSNKEIHQDFIDSLEILAQSLRFGNHILVCNANTLVKIINLHGLSISAKGVYRYLLGKFSFLYSYLQIFSRQFELTALDGDPEIIDAQDHITVRVNMVKFAKYTILNPSILLSENIDDAKFYHRLAEIFIIQNGYRDKIKLMCECRGGGGSTTHSEYESIKKAQNRLCICIIDSDKKHPRSGLGNTAKKTIDADKLIQNILCELHIINVHEAENLIPLEFIDSLCVEKPHYTRLIKYFQIVIKLLPPIQQEDFLKYYDFKKGINFKKLICNTTEFSKFWIEILNTIDAMHIGLNDIDIACYCYECELTKCRFVMFPGFGDRLISAFLEHKDKSILVSTKIEQFPKYLKICWNEIGKLVASWCCSLPPIISH